MLKILWKRGEIQEQFLVLSTIFCYLIIDFYVKTRIRFSLRDKWSFAITEVKITRVDCTCITNISQIKNCFNQGVPVNIFLSGHSVNDFYH